MSMDQMSVDEMNLDSIYGHKITRKNYFKRNGYMNDV